MYKVSLSLVILLWGLVFLLSLWISHGDGYEGESPFEFPLCFCYRFVSVLVFGCQRPRDFVGVPARVECNMERGQRRQDH